MIGDGFDVGVLRFLQPIVDLALDAADLDDRVVRLVDFVANRARDVELRPQIRVAHVVERMFLDDEVLGLRAAVDRQARLIRAGQRRRSALRRAPEHHAGECDHRLILQVPGESLQSDGDGRRRGTAASATAASFFFVSRLRNLFTRPTCL